MQFKGNSQALKGQFESKNFNSMLYAVTHLLDAWVWKQFRKRLVITCVNRTPEAQVDSCKKYKYKSRFEHTAGEAVDIRSRNLTPPEIEDLLFFYESYLTWMCRLEYHEKKDPKKKGRWIIYPHFHLTTAGAERRQDKICEIVEKTEGAEAFFVG